MRPGQAASTHGFLRTHARAQKRTRAGVYLRKRHRQAELLRAKDHDEYLRQMSTVIRKYACMRINGYL